jgi:hypothetical protein
MINSVKGSRKVKRTNTSNLLLTDGPDNMIMNCKECSNIVAVKIQGIYSRNTGKYLQTMLTVDGVNCRRTVELFNDGYITAKINWKHGSASFRKCSSYKK